MKKMSLNSIINALHIEVNNTNESKQLDCEIFEILDHLKAERK